jgi:hypothetical protein
MARMAAGQLARAGLQEMPSQQGHIGGAFAKRR